MASPVVPLIIDGKDVLLDSHTFVPNPDVPNPSQWRATGATPQLCIEAVESCARTFKTWRNTSMRERQLLFVKLAKYYRDHGPELKSIIPEEIFCGPLWAEVNLNDIINFTDQAAALCTSGVLSATVPEVEQPGSHAVVYKTPLGVILGMAPWNAPATLGLRSVLAAVATGNTAILKGSELSPRTHYFVANGFREAGFPPGVVNFVLHRPQDAPATFEAMISHPAVRKCNFTGSTQVGRHIAMTAASYLKPVLMELGGKNFAIVLDDANLEKAAACILAGAYLNNGQICMSTDVVLVTESNKASLVQRLREGLPACAAHFDRVIHNTSNNRIVSLIEDAQTKGATVYSVPGRGVEHCKITFLQDITTDMQFWHEEAFGPIFGLATVKNVDEAVDFVNSCPYGLSSAIFTKPGLAAVDLAKRLEVGAVHINGSTTHDEATLPHGGVKNSGWGRFGSHWGFDEFTQTQTVILNED